MEGGIFHKKWRNLHVRKKYIYHILIQPFSSNPKTYFAICRDSDEFKRSSKGVQLRTALTYEQFKAVVYENACIPVKNVSIRVFKGQMSTVETNKVGLQNIFIKGYVEEDQVTVRPFSRFVHKE